MFWFLMVSAVLFFAEEHLSSSINSAIESVLTSLFAAIVFYVVVDYLPKTAEQRKVATTLNVLLESVFWAYYERPVSAEVVPPISRYTGRQLDLEWLDELDRGLKYDVGTQEQLRRVVYAAHMRLDDFRFALSMAASLSADHAKAWLEVTNYVRQLAALQDQHDYTPACMTMSQMREPVRNWLQLIQSV